MLTIVQAINIGQNFNSRWGKSLSLGDLISVLISGGLTIAGIIMIFLFIGGGLQMIASAGNNDPRGTSQGKQAVTAAIIGFVIVFTAFWIIKLIELIIGVTIITSPIGSA